MRYARPPGLALFTYLIAIHVQTQQAQMVIWMLRHRLLIQLHTYVFLLAASPPTQDSSTSISSTPSLVIANISASESNVSSYSDSQASISVPTSSMFLSPERILDSQSPRAFSGSDLASGITIYNSFGSFFPDTAHIMYAHRQDRH